MPRPNLAKGSFGLSAIVLVFASDVLVGHLQVFPCVAIVMGATRYCEDYFSVRNWTCPWVAGA